MERDEVVELFNGMSFENRGIAQMYSVEIEIRMLEREREREIIEHRKNLIRLNEAILKRQKEINQSEFTTGKKE